MRIFTLPPSQYEIDHASAIKAGLNFQTTHEGQLPSTAAWKMLEFRQALNPTRFKIYHPNLSKMIENSFTYSTHCEFPVVPTCPVVDIPCLPNVWVECPPVQMANQTVPEPTTALLLGVGLVWMFITKFWSRG